MTVAITRELAKVGTLAFTIRCVPPSTTAQMKRRSKSGHYYHPEKIKRAEQTWAALLQPHVPKSPVNGAVELVVTLIYPHNKGTKLGDRCYLLPKETRPDLDNVCKALIDLLSRMRFIEDDAKVSRLIVEKFHGPEAHIGIRVAIQPMFPTLPGVSQS